MVGTTLDHLRHWGWRSGCWPRTTSASPPVGVASAAVAAMTLFGFMGTLGLGTLLMGDLPRRSGKPSVPAQRRTPDQPGGGHGPGPRLRPPHAALSSNLAPLGESLASTAFFALGVGLTALAFVLDQALIGLLHGGLQLVRNIVFATVKLAGDDSDRGARHRRGRPVDLLAPGPRASSLSLVVLVRFYAQRDGDRLWPNFALLVKMRASAASHAAVNLALETRRPRDADPGGRAAVGQREREPSTSRG